MINASLAEKKFFILFLALFLLTFIFFNSINQGYWLLVWGLYNLSRFIYLNDTDNKKIPKILNLPSRILFGLNQEKEKYIGAIKQLYTSKICFVFYLVLIMYLGYMTYDFFLSYNDLSNAVKKEILFYHFLSRLVKTLLILNIILVSLSFYHLTVGTLIRKIGKNS